MQGAKFAGLPFQAVAQYERLDSGRAGMGRRRRAQLQTVGDVAPLDMGGEEAGLGFAEIDPDRIAKARAQVPSLANRRAIPEYRAS